MGGGYYDRCSSFLQHRRNLLHPKLIAVAFACQEVEKITPNPWDIRLYQVITENTGPASRFWRKRKSTRATLLPHFSNSFLTLLGLHSLTHICIVFFANAWRSHMFTNTNCGHKRNYETTRTRDM